MSLPELGGLADGVVIALCILVALVIVVFAWWSTNVSETRVVGVIYLSTSHFNRLLQHLGQTPATGTAAGRPAAFLGPSVDSDSGNPVSQPHAASDTGHSSPPGAVTAKRDDAPLAPSDYTSQHVDSTDDARETYQHECRVAADRDVCVDSQTDGAHSRDNCTDLGRLHSTPDGMVLEGCTHLDDRLGGVCWTGADAGETGSGVRHRRGGPPNPTAAIQLDDTNVTPTYCRPSSQLMRVNENDQEHQDENDTEGRVWGLREAIVDEDNAGENRVGECSGADDSVLDTTQSDDNRVQKSTVLCQVVQECPSLSTNASCGGVASVASYSEQLANAASETRDLRDGIRCTENTFEETIPSVAPSEGVHLVTTRDNEREETALVGLSTAADSAVTRTVLTARQTTSGYVTVRLKYLDDQQRDVQTRLEDTVADFKRQHFAAELSANCNVRFVHNGQELRGDTATLGSFNVVDNSVIHCWLSRPPQPATVPGTGLPTAAATQLDFSCLVLPLFAMLLLLVWYCRFSYHVYFSAISTFCLVAMTLVFAVCMFVSLQFSEDAIDEVTM